MVFRFGFQAVFEILYVPLAILPRLYHVNINVHKNIDLFVFINLEKIHNLMLLHNVKNAFFSSKFLYELHSL